ncbi:MAG: hypothetical protein E7576_03000 [Ruminococcaceae bacterium]|nr:hypothetical protein [Oscillospiraceae bacterium]
MIFDDVFDGKEQNEFVTDGAIEHNGHFWRAIPCCNGLFVSDEGQIYNSYTHGYTYGYPNHEYGDDSYLRVSILYPDRQHFTTEYVHRLVAAAFLANPDLLDEINHKSENKQDNRVSNLEWINTASNRTYGTRVQRILESKREKGLIK